MYVYSSLLIQCVVLFFFPLSVFFDTCLEFIFLAVISGREDWFHFLARNFSSL